MTAHQLTNIRGAAVGPDKIESFQVAFRGEVIRPGDAAFEMARRIWNASIDRRPGMIARATGVADVIAAVNFARENDLLVAVRGGGHNVGGRAVCEGGLVIDLSRMKGIHVDAKNRRVRVQGGATLGDVDPGNARLRPGRAIGDRLQDRCRRPHPGRGSRVARQEARLQLRQRGVLRARGRGRQGRRGERRGARGPVLGSPRGRGKLRAGHYPLLDAIQPMPFPQMQSMLDGAFPNGNQYYWKSTFVRELNDEAIDILVDRANQATSPLTAVVAEYYGGVGTRGGVTDTAFPHRVPQHDIVVAAQWTDPGESSRHIEWARRLAD